MKKILIVNNNMKLGGVQKSLYNLLWTMGEQYHVTLLLFSRKGVLTDRLPPAVKILECRSLFRYLGISQGECTGVKDKLTRGFLAAFCKVFGRAKVMKLLLASQKTLPETYDCAISYLHNGGAKSFYGGVQEFVLNRVNASKKVAFLHCDFRNCGGNFPENNRQLDQFHLIAACSDGCRQAFLQVRPELAKKCVTVRNCHCYDQIRAMAQQEPVTYDPTRQNVLMVSRLAHEKGVERAVLAAARCIREQLPVSLHIVGGGPMEAPLRQQARELGIDQYVHFYGEQENPYRYMTGADLFFMTSFHEAAPMVIEEAACLGLPVLTVETTSSRDMVLDAGCGWVCANCQEAIEEALLQVLRDPQSLQQRKARLRQQTADNTAAMTQFAAMIKG